MRLPHPFSLATNDAISSPRRVAWLRLLVLALLTISFGPALSAAERKPNVLLIISEDLRDAVGCYGHPMAKTPNIDRLRRARGAFRPCVCAIPRLQNAATIANLNIRLATLPPWPAKP